MNVVDVMTKDPVTVTPEDSLLTATRLLKEHPFKHLPVISGDSRLVGVVTDRDLKRASASDATTLEVHELLYLLDRLQVAKIMTRDTVTVGPDESIQHAARLMIDKHVGCLPVMRDNRLVGIVTRDDLLKLLAEQ